MLGGTGNNSGIRILTARRDGFVAVEAPYIFASDITDQPSLTTVELTVPGNCPEPHTSILPASEQHSATGCSYDHAENKCPQEMPAANCTSDADCNAPHIPRLAAARAGGSDRSVLQVCVFPRVPIKASTSRRIYVGLADPPRTRHLLQEECSFM